MWLRYECELKAEVARAHVRVRVDNLNNRLDRFFCLNNKGF
jgi:hypothetical protein